MKNSPRPVSVVYQTHWDREWYFSHQAFVARLLRVMAQVTTLLETDQIAHFMFDGQTAGYADLLAHAEPDLQRRVQRLAAQGRLILGPWFVMADEFLVSGESLIRNLEIGMADANHAGNCQRVGYLPDTFGHIAQMPQLLREFNIDCAVVWRGVDCEHAAFDWHAADGSTVGTVYLTEGYYQHPLNVADYRAAVSAYVNKAASRGLSEHVLLTQGGDHLQPHPQVKSRMAQCNAGQTDYVLQESTLEEYVQTALAASEGKRGTINGELRANTQSFLLPDVLSTRRYLKRQHQALEDRLINEIEPLFAQLCIQTPQRALAQCWRSLIEAQAHDSICGCSIDEVHHAMEHRFAALTAQMDGLSARAGIDSGMRATQQHGTGNAFADDAKLTLFNPRVQMHKGALVVSIFLEGSLATSLTVSTNDGVRLRNTITSTAPDTAFFSPDDDFPDTRAGHRYEVVIWARINAMGNLAVTVEKSTTPAATGAKPKKRAIENARLRLQLDAVGTLTLSSRKSGQVQEQVLALRYEMDAGDSYNFSPPTKQVGLLHAAFSLVDIVARDGVQEMRLRVAMQVPAALSANRLGPAATTTENHGVLKLSLIDGENAVRATLHWTNTALDQRTRLILLTPQEITESFADSAFIWQRRAVALANYPKEISRAEMPPAVLPSLSAIQAGGLFFHHRAMHEFEILETRAIGVTLVRSVGWMSRRDLTTRGVGAGPDMATPEAQCLRDDVFEFQFGLVEENSNAEAADVLASAEAFRRPPFALHGHTTRWRAALDLGNTHVRLSALRTVGEARELRVWNPTGAPQTVALGPAWLRIHADGRGRSGARCEIAPHALATWGCGPA